MHDLRKDYFCQTGDWIWSSLARQTVKIGAKFLKCSVQRGVSMSAPYTLLSCLCDLRMTMQAEYQSGTHVNAVKYRTGTVFIYACTLTHTFILSSFSGRDDAACDLVPVDFHVTILSSSCDHIWKPLVPKIPRHAKIPYK